jgi:uncharacterized protein YndB with AHSA1/START domain
MSQKIQYTLEFPVKASPKMLFPFLSTPSGLAEWFANDVNFKGDLVTFIWDNSEEQAEIISKKANVYIRYRWLEDEDDDGYFEFRIVIDDLTTDVSLLLIDHAEEDEMDETKRLWESQIHNLLHVIGS